MPASTRSRSSGASVVGAFFVGLATQILAGCTPAPSEGDGTVPRAESVYVQTARSAATWIRSAAVVTEGGVTWPADPNEAASTSADLYAGSPGVVLFFLELAAHLQDDSYLDDARRGADHLLALLDGPDGEEPRPALRESGLYSGLAGIGFVLHETFAATSDHRYREGALRAVEAIHAQAQEVGDGVEWVDSTDIVSGTAGIGLFLLYAATELEHEPSLALAERAGHRLLEVAETHDVGLAWRIRADYPRLMPNFSHGTAGVAYFLASLHEATGKAPFLDAAEAGAERLLALADTEGDVCLVFHHTEGGENLQYMSWCHGPAGTARTFYKLWQVTGDRRWMEWTERSARGIRRSGIPGTLTEGFWNNVGQCCGSAGVAEFALAMHAVTGDEHHLELARRLADDVIARGIRQGEGTSWPQAEHRVQPELIVAQTGFMQGAAGIGVMLLHLDAALDGRPPAAIALPDSPFARR